MRTNSGRRYVAAFIRVLGIALPVCLAVACRPSVPELTDADVRKLISCIPDHGMGPRHAFTEQYYSLLEESWAVPSDCPWGIGSEEWLLYFISGNGDLYDSVSVRSISQSADVATVRFDCIWNCCGTESHTLNLCYSDSCWVIENYDGTLEDMYDYISSRRAYFRSQEWDDYLENDEYIDAGMRAKAKRDVKDYFSRYPDDRPAR